MLENTPIVIERLGSVMANWGCFGDSVINSAADMSWMAFGFWLALRQPVKMMVLFALVGDLLATSVVHDNLTLKVIMLLFPVVAIAEWQAAGTQG